MWIRAADRLINVDQALGASCVQVDCEEDTYKVVFWLPTATSEDDHVVVATDLPKQSALDLLDNIQEHLDGGTAVLDLREEGKKGDG